MKIEIPDNPNWENNAELKKISAKLDSLSQQMALVIGHLQAISINTKKSAIRP